MSLDQFDHAFNPANNSRPAGLEALEDGPYQLEIVHAELVQLDKTGETILRWRYRVTAGPQTGTLCEAATFFRTPLSANLLGADLAILGYPVHEWTVAAGKPFSRMLRETVPSLAGKAFRCNKTSGLSQAGKPWHNIRIVSVAPSMPQPVEPSFDKDDMPF